MLLDIVLLMKNLQIQFAKFLKSNNNTLFNQNRYNNWIVKLLNLLYTPFILYSLLISMLKVLLLCL